MSVVLCTRSGRWSYKTRYYHSAKDVVRAIVDQKISTFYLEHQIGLKAELYFSAGTDPVGFSTDVFNDALVELCSTAPSQQDADFKARMKIWKPQALKLLAEASCDTLV